MWATWKKNPFVIESHKGNWPSENVELKICFPISYHCLSNVYI